MEFLSGRKLVDGIRDSFAALAAVMGMSLEDMQRQSKRAPGDPLHSAKMPSVYKVKMMLFSQLVWDVAYNWCVALPW